MQGAESGGRKIRASAAEVANRRLIDCLAKGCLSMALHACARVWVSGCEYVCLCVCVCGANSDLMALKHFSACHKKHSLLATAQRKINDSVLFWHFLIAV